MKTLSHLAFYACVLSLFSACGMLPDNGAKVSFELPSRSEFDSVAPVLIHGCGTLDCHGNKFRNFSLVGQYSRRLDEATKADGSATTKEEIDWNYEGIISIEPELISDVVSGVQPPDRLTVIRKANGGEAHKAGAARFAKGGDADICLSSWFAKKFDKGACDKAPK